MLAGKLLAAALSGSAALTLSQISSTSSFVSNITVPASGAAVGDLAVILSFARSTVATPPDLTPSGWTKISTITNTVANNIRISAFYKILTAGDIGTNFTTLTNNAGLFGFTINQLWIWRPSKAIATVTALDIENYGSSSAASHTINISGVAGPLLAIGHACSQTDAPAGWLQWTGYSPSASFEYATTNGQNDPFHGKYTLINSGNAVGNIVASITDLGSQNLETFYLTIR